MAMKSIPTSDMKSPPMTRSIVSFFPCARWTLVIANVRISAGMTKIQIGIPNPGDAAIKAKQTHASVTNKNRVLSEYVAGPRVVRNNDGGSGGGCAPGFAG